MIRKRWLRWVLTLLLAGLVALAFSGGGERLAEDYVGAAFKRALVAFALVRAINAVVSVVQGTEVAIEPAGVGVILTPGEVLDPLNDLIERFSWVMLLATTSLGTQKVLVTASGSGLLQVALGAASGVGLLLTWRARLFGAVGWRTLALRFVILILFVRFAVPAVALLNHGAYQAFLADRFEASYAALEQTKIEVERVRDEPSLALEEDADILDRVGRWIDRTSERLDVERRLAVYEEKIGRATEQVVDLIVVFVLTTIVFPLIFLYLGLRLMRIVGQIHWWPEE